MGVLFSRRVRGSEVFSFKYDEEWLQTANLLVLDPALHLYQGEQHLQDEEKTNFGIFSDSSPDRWGKVLMQRREAVVARTEKRTPRKLFQTDYLLGVYDGHRMGALRFKLEKDGNFLDDNTDMATPPWTSIRELEDASLKIENEELVDDPEYAKWLKILLGPGASLGGGRPKASVQNADGHLWIAKFPSHQDNGDQGGWEMITYEMAIESGIDMAASVVKKFTSNYHTFITKRFDRTKQGGRFHFASAMTMLGYADGIDHTAGASYLEIAEFLVQNGANVNRDLKELFRRIVFSICVSNTDDHLRNHGFILTDMGWVLSPAYDINPRENSDGLILNISQDDNSLDLDLALSVHKEFRLTEKEAVEITTKTVSVVSTWKNRAAKLGISRTEIMDKKTAFNALL
ncbi:MAG: HipA domain-containing protein [Flavobacteriales bacterium]|nr:HipA domain-containing protein [Flavobacteriales bacterium]